MRDWFQERRYLLILVLTAVFILALGSWLKPPKRSPEVAVSEAERFRLQMLAQKRSLQNLSRYFSDVAAHVGGSVVRVEGSHRNGVVWDQDGQIVTVCDRESRAGSVLTGAGAKAEVTESRPTPGIPVTTLRAKVPPAVEPVREIAAQDPDSGDWAVLVSRREDGSLSFLQSTSGGMADVVCEEVTYRALLINLPQDLITPGAGLFDIDGRLAAVCVPCGERKIVALTARSVRAALERAHSPEGVFAGRFGLRVAELTPQAASHLRAKGGVLVSEVWDQSAAAGAGLKPGDVVTEVHGETPQSAAQFVASANKESSLSLTVLRHRRVLKISLRADGPAPPATAAAPASPGLFFESAPPGQRIERLEPGGRAAQAGLKAGDRLVEIDGRPIRRAELKSALAAGKGPAHVVVWRAGRRIGVFLP